MSTQVSRKNLSPPPREKRKRNKNLPPPPGKKKKKQEQQIRQWVPLGRDSKVLALRLQTQRGSAEFGRHASRGERMPCSKLKRGGFLPCRDFGVRGCTRAKMTLFPSGWPNKKRSVLFATNMVFPKSLQSRNSRSEIRTQSTLNMGFRLAPDRA